MNKKIPQLILISLMSCILGGCLSTTSTLKIDYTPSHYSKITDSTETIEVNRLKDVRGVDPKFISYKGAQYRGIYKGAYISERDVSDIVKDAIKNLLTNQNYRIVNDQGMLTLTGEILKFQTIFLSGFWGSRSVGNIQVNLRLLDNKNGNIIWNETFSGNAEKRGVHFDTESHRKEVLEMALDNLMSNISDSISFNKAIERSD
jgi:ABC-type uncharacterized transport system auxiliary subunit